MTSVCCLLAPFALILGAVWILLAESWASCFSCMLGCCWRPTGLHPTCRVAPICLPFRGTPGLPFWAALVIVRAECIYLLLSTVGEQAGSHSFLCVRVPSGTLGWKQPLLHDIIWERMVLKLLAGFCGCVDWIAVEIKNMGLILHMSLFFQWCKSMFNCCNAGGKAELSFLRPFATDNITLKKQR